MMCLSLLKQPYFYYYNNYCISVTVHNNHTAPSAKITLNSVTWKLEKSHTHR